MSDWVAAHSGNPVVIRQGASDFNRWLKRVRDGTNTMWVLLIDTEDLLIAIPTDLNIAYERSHCYVAVRRA